MQIGLGQQGQQGQCHPPHLAVYSRGGPKLAKCCLF